MEGLRVLKTPCILHWNMNHFVVLRKVSKEHMLIVDPSGGARRISLRVAARSFTGVALELQPVEGFAPIDDGEQVVRLRDYWHQVLELRRFLFQLLMLTGIVQAFALISPLYVQLTVDKVVPHYDKEFLLVLVMGFGLIALI